MGNAMSFLDNKEHRDLTRKGSYNAKCQKKIDKYLESNEPTTCPDQILVKKGTNDKTIKVNQKFNMESNLPGYRSRRYHKREHSNCECCGADYIPSKRGGRPTQEVLKKYGAMTAWCPKCTRVGSTRRAITRKCGSWENYDKLSLELRDWNWIKKETSFRELLIEEQKRIFLDRDYNNIKNRVEILIDKAFEENELKSVRDSHYKFDF